MGKRSLRTAGAVSAVAIAIVAAGCGSSSNSASSSTATTTPATTTPGGGTNSAAFQAFQTCLAQHGVTGFTPGAGRPGGGGGGGAGSTRTAAQQQAFTACRSELPSGGFPGRGGGGAGPGRNASNPAFAKYTACLKQHGVTLGGSNSQKAFATASAACAKYRPTTTGGATQ
jgi:hypothetical protein